MNNRPKYIMTSPWRCRVWDLHDRMFDSLTTQNCSDIIQSIKSEGQLYPAISRIVRGEPDVDIEIVCGARRLYAAQQLEIDLKVDLKELDDRKALRNNLKELSITRLFVTHSPSAIAMADRVLRFDDGQIK